MSHPLPTGYREARISAALSRTKRSRITLTGKDVPDFLHRLSTNDLSTLPEGEDRQTIFTTEKGRIVDVVHVTRTPTGAELTADPGAATRLPEWLERFIIMDDVRIGGRQGDWEGIHLIGPDSPAIVKRISGDAPPGFALREDLGSIPGYLLPHGPGLAGCPELDAATFDTLRVEEGVPAPGKEITADFNPLEAGLKRHVSFTKGCYIGQEVIARLDTYRKLQKILTTFEFPGHTGLRLAPGKLIHDGEEAGMVTSTVFSPSRGEWIGLGYRRLKSDAEGLILNPGDGSAPVAARCLKGLPDEYDLYEITDEAE